MYKILLAEDDADMRFIYSRMSVWKDSGFVIAKEVSNGRDALAAVKSEKFDLVLTDIRMPFIDGIQLLEKMNELGISIAVVFISSYDEFEYARKGLVLGAFDYLLKPVNEQKLGDMLKRVGDKLAEQKGQNTFADNVLCALEALGKRAEDNFTQDICAYFSNTSCRDISVEQAAEHFGFSRDYFGKMFRRQLGESFSRFSTLVKIEYAKELLRQSGLKTYEISEELGYSSADYFTKVFKDITGLSPAQYKQRK
ncbi:response regulator [Ruminococcus sp.]|uniref:response regulator transcription factor n=1 Tax=Ruminococcus sp. TaxID=41978 RepID=UPI0025EFECDD|nr:response regulator [Ruminococcus sp.]